MDTKTTTLQHKRKALDLDGALGSAIRAVRDSQGLRQSEVAKGFGCHQPEISKLEAGQRSLKVSELPQLAEALGVPLEELVNDLLASIKEL